MLGGDENVNGLGQALSFANRKILCAHVQCKKFKLARAASLNWSTWITPNMIG